jgi:hypothetical protein
MNLRSFLFLVFAIQCLFADLWLADAESDAADLKIAEKPMFVSLGSSCIPAGMLRNGGLRDAAFPLDWLLSLDTDGVIKAIEDDFNNFLNDEYLIPDNFLIQKASGASLVHLDYHFEFVHEGDFFGSEYEENMHGLRDRYQRRIDRFRGLAEYPGTVVFLRCSYKMALTDPHRYYKCKEVIDISDADSMKLYSALKERFPRGKIKLLIMNEGASPLDGIVIEKMLGADVIKVRHYFATQPELFIGFGEFLINHSALWETK